MEKLLNKYLRHLEVGKGYSRNTIDAYSYRLNLFFTFLCGKPLVNVDKNDVIRYLHFLADKGYRKKNDKVTRAHALSIIHSFFKYLKNEAVIIGDPAERVDPPKIDKKEPSFLTKIECDALLQAVEMYSTRGCKLRDSAIIKLFLTSGIRLSELVNLNVKDVDFKESTMRVFRKGGKEQLLPLNQDGAEAISKYLIDRNNGHEAVFTSKRGNRLSKGTVTYLVKKYMKKAGIQNKKLSPHTLRHSFCTALLSKGVNIAIIQELAGHNSLETVRRYVHLTNIDLRNAINKLEVNN
ncbi:MAG: tyrosine-type recombinase/integrase [Candidatus Saganbacteria bacterium]|nr:tyrosine-type recombinase/integrase [Candidatus Saganbacteria bacterium]